MGTYYRLVNITKKQFYEPINGAVKYGNFVFYAEEAMLMLLNSWLGDEVVLASDYSDEGWWDRCDEEGFEQVTGQTLLYRDPEDARKATMDRNGCIKVLKQFVHAYGHDQIAVMLDKAALEVAAKEEK